MYSKEEFLKDCHAVFQQTIGNTVEIPGTGDTVLFDTPLTGFAAADDALFKRFTQPEIIGENYLTPAEWLPSAKTVISFFLPFSEKVRSSNRADKEGAGIHHTVYGRIAAPDGRKRDRELCAEFGCALWDPDRDDIRKRRR